MKKTTIVLSGLIMIAASAFMTSCNKQGEAAKEEAAEQAPAKAAKDGNLKIAFVNIDTLQNQYQAFKDVESEFEKKRANAESTINSKGSSFTTQMQEFQRKAQSNQYTQEQFNQEQARLGKLQQDLAALQERLSASLQEELAAQTQAISDSILSFAKSFAKEKGYDFILAKGSGIDQVLYADPAYDITKEVVAALNKRYKKK